MQSTASNDFAASKSHSNPRKDGELSATELSKISELEQRATHLQELKQELDGRA